MRAVFGFRKMQRTIQVGEVWTVRPPFLKLNYDLVVAELFRTDRAHILFCHFSFLLQASYAMVCPNELITQAFQNNV